MRKVLTTLLLCAMLLPLLAGIAAAESAPVAIEPAEAFAGGSGTAEDPFQIATAQQLALLARVINQEYGYDRWDEEELYLKGYYVLTADIALNDTANFANWETEAPSCVWIPIGAATKDDERGYTSAFKGVFDGQGHTISGLYSLSDILHDKEKSTGGLFGEIDKAQIRNVSLTDAMLIAAERQEAGLLVGSGSGSVIENCHVSGRLIVDDVRYSGGVAGQVFGGVLADCSFTGSIAAENMTGYVGGVCGSLFNGEGRQLVGSAAMEVSSSPQLSGCGGVAGLLYGGTIRDSRSEGCITVQGAVNAIGGICGNANGSSSSTEDANGNKVTVPVNAEIIGCVHTGSVNAPDATAVGGILGYGFNCFRDKGIMSLQGCVNSGSVVGKEDVGGIAGAMFSYYTGYQLQQCVNTGSVMGDTIAGGIVGKVHGNIGASVIEGCENQGSVLAATTEGGTAGGILGWGVAPNLSFSEGDSGSLTITGCRNSGSIAVVSGTAGGILSRLMHDGNDFFIDISRCENTGVIHSDGSGRLGGILGGCTAGYVIGRYNGAACFIRSCVNRGDLTYGDAAINAVDFIPGEPGDGRVLNATEKTVVAMGGSAAGGVVGSSFGTVVESCLNQGHILLSEGMTPISDIEANVRVTEEDQVVFVGGICGLSLYSSDGDYAFDKEHYTDCAYTDSFAAAVYAPFLPADSEVIAGNRQITVKEAESLAAELLR